MKSFTQKVIEVVKNIPKGEVMSYKEVAQKVGSPQASRAVGSIMAKNQDLDVPCHRVIHTNGKLGGYNGLQGNSKRELLSKEDVMKS